MIGGLALLLSIGLLGTRRIDAALRVCAVQAVCAALALAPINPPVALVVAIVNGGALPWAIAQRALPREIAARPSPLLAWAALVILLAGVFAAFAKAAPHGTVAIAVAILLIGLALPWLHRHALSPVIGLLSAQNGVILLVGIQPDMPPHASLIAALPFVPALVLAESRLRHLVMVGEGPSSTTSHAAVGQQPGQRAKPAPVQPHR